MVTTPLPGAAMVRKADQELADLHRRRTSAQELIAETQHELTDLGARCTERRTAHHQANERWTQARQATQEAQTLAELAQGTPSEATAMAKLKDARTVEKSVEKSALETHKQLEAAEATLAKRGPSLQRSLADNQALIAALDARTLALQAAREQAQEALGEETYQHVTAQLRTLKEQIQQQGRNLVDTKLELEAACQAACDTLSPWPQLSEQARTEYSMHEDATTRLLNAFLAFLDVVEADGPAVPRQIGSHFVMTDLELTRRDFADFIDYGTYPHGFNKLAAKREAIKDILRQHLERR